MPTDNIKIYTDTVLRHTILQGQEAERTEPGTFAMGELAFTRDTGRVFVGTYTDNRTETDHSYKEGGLIVGNKFYGIVDNFDNGIQKIEYCARHIPDTNFYEGDTIFDKNAANLIIFNRDEKNIKIKSFDVPDSDSGILQATLNTDKNCFDISINEEKLQNFISTKLQRGLDPTQKRGLYYLNSLKTASYSNNIATITKDNFPTEVDDDTYKLINSVILQLDINTTTLPVDISLETVNGHVLQTHPKGSGNYTTTIEIPYTIDENDVKQFQLYCNQPDYATIKILGYRI